MHLQVDPSALRAAAVDLRQRSTEVRGTAVAAGHVGGLRDPSVAGALAQLTDVCADALELVACDLALVADRVGAAAVVYTATEQAVGHLADVGRRLGIR